MQIEAVSGLTDACCDYIPIQGWISATTVGTARSQGFSFEEYGQQIPDKLRWGVGGARNGFVKLPLAKFNTIPLHQLHHL